MSASQILPRIDLDTQSIPATALLASAAAGGAWVAAMGALSWWLGTHHGARAAAAGPMVVHTVLAGCFVAGALLSARPAKEDA